MFTCCANLSDGVTPCGRAVKFNGDLCWQHKKLGRACRGFQPYEVAPKLKKKEATPPPLKVQDTRSVPESKFKLTPIMSTTESKDSKRVILSDNFIKPASSGMCGSRLGLCTWPKNMAFRGKHTWTIDPGRLYAELYNHASVHGGDEQARLLEREDPTTWCDVLRSNVWPEDNWIDKQYAYIEQHKNTNVGISSKTVPFSFLIEKYIEDASQIENQGGDMKKINALIRNSTAVDRPFYVWRGVSVTLASLDEKIAWFNSFQNESVLQLPQDHPLSTTIDSYEGLGFATGGARGWKDIQEDKTRGVLIRILVPHGAKALPVGRYFPPSGDRNLEQEVWLPSDAKIRIIQSSFRRTKVVYNFPQSEWGAPKNPSVSTNYCDTIELLTVEAIYEA